VPWITLQRGEHALVFGEEGMTAIDTAKCTEVWTAPY
jgi:hypothetical protein